MRHAASKPKPRPLRYLLYAVYAILAGVIALALFDRFAAWDVTEHTEEYFGPDFAVSHTADPVLYEQVPPVGGPHAGVPQACGFYDRYVFNEHAVHSLEHGAVWITYDPSLAGDDLETLKAMATQPYVLVSPYPGLPSAIVVSAWGHQMTLDSVDEDKINAFRSTYGNNREYTPEFGASCGIRFTDTTDSVPQQQPLVRSDPDSPAIGGIDIYDATSTADPNVNPRAGTPAASPVVDEAALVESPADDQ